MSTPLVYDHQIGQATPALTAERNRRTLDPGKPVVDFLLGLMDQCVSENRERNLILHRRGVRMQKMYEGDLGDFHPTSGAWVSRPSYAMGSKNQKTGKTSPWFPHNKIRRYFDANTAQSLQARIDLRAIATRDDDRSQLAASAARPIVDYHERQICDELFVQEWDKQKRCYGEVAFFCYWDTNAGPEVDEIGVAEEDYLPGGSIYTCLGCGQSGDDQDMGEGCPSCGPTTQMAQDDFPPMRLPVIGVVGKKRAGDFCVDIVPKLQHDYDRFAPLYKKAGWYSRTRRMRVEELQSQVDWYKIPVGREESDNRAVDYVESGTGNTGRYSVPYRRFEGDRRTTLRQFWFRPYLLDLIPEADLPLLGGDKIKKGWKLSEQYPNGAYILFSNRNILDIWNDEHFDHRWVQLKHKHIPNRLDGDGGEDIIRPAQEYNELRSYLMSAWRFNVARPQVVRAPLKEADWQVGNPVVQVAGLPQGVSLKDLHSVAEPVAIDQSAMPMMQMADAEMQGAEAAFSTVTGDPDVQAQGGGKTLGGLQLIEGNAQEMRLPELSLVALAYKQIHQNGLYFFKECASETRWIPFKAQAGELAGMYLKGSDLDGDIELSFGKGSYLPKDSQRRRANLMGAIEVGQGLVLNPQAPPKWRQMILDVFELDIEIDEYTEDVKNARERIEQMKRLAPQAQQMAGMVAQVAAQIGGQNAGNGYQGDYGTPGNAPSESAGGGVSVPQGMAPSPQAGQGEASGGFGLPGMDQGERLGQLAAEQSVNLPAGYDGTGVAEREPSSQQGPGNGAVPTGNQGLQAGTGQGGQAIAGAGQTDNAGTGNLSSQSQGAVDYNQQQPPAMGTGQAAQGIASDSPGLIPPPPSAAELLCQMVPIDPKVDDHAVHYQFVKSWLKGDEAKKVDPDVNEAMHIRLDEHEQAGAMVAAMQQMTAMQANAPQMMMAQGQQNQQNAREDARMQGQASREDQHKADDREHQLALEDKRQSGAREVAAMRASQTKAAKR